MTDPTATPPEPATERAATHQPAVDQPAVDQPVAESPAPGAPVPDAPTGQMPEYKGEPLDAERGPGLGCFWIQIALLTFFLIFTPLTVTWGWDPVISGALLIFTLILLLFSGQTIIFLLRLVAADRRTRRTPLDPKAKRTVGQLEDASAPAETPSPKTAPESPSDPNGTERTDD
jgi:hypothetical protein